MPVALPSKILLYPLVIGGYTFYFAICSQQALTRIMSVRKVQPESTVLPPGHAHNRFWRVAITLHTFTSPQGKGRHISSSTTAVQAAHSQSPDFLLQPLLASNLCKGCSWTRPQFLFARCKRYIRGNSTSTFPPGHLFEHVQHTGYILLSHTVLTYMRAIISIAS